MVLTTSDDSPDAIDIRAGKRAAISLAETPQVRQRVDILERIALRPGPPDLYRLTGLQSPHQAPSPRDGVVEYFGKTGDRPYSAYWMSSANRAGDSWSFLAPGSIEQTLCHIGGSQRHVTRQRHNMTEAQGLRPLQRSYQSA